MQQTETRILVDPEPALNVAELLAQRASRTPDLVLFQVPDGAPSSAAGPRGWRPITAAQFQQRVVDVAKGFVAAGIQPGDRIGLLSSTRYEWSVVDFAAWYAGALVVPVYETSSPDQVRHILEDSDAAAIVVETAEHYTRVDEVQADLPNLHSVWQLHLGGLDKLAASGRDVPDQEIERRRRLAVASDTATIIYTAGTTGKPKGCVLTHGNFVELTRNVTIDIPEIVHEQAATLLFVTLAHVFARFISVLAVSGGIRVGHQADTSQLVPSLGSFKPTFLLAVPRVFEKVYNSAEQRAEASGRGAAFRWAVDVGVRWSEAKVAGRVPLALAVQYRAADALVFRKLRAVLGGQCRWAVSGSAPLGKRLNHFYRAIGVTILEGYGLTETTAPITVNRPAAAKVGTVGPPLPGSAIRIAADGEIEVSGIGVFPEYIHNAKATAEAFDGEWFRTGDIGSLDDDGHLLITGRKKEIIITAGGKNVSPAELEDPIRADPIVSQVVVVGDQRPFIAALVTLDTEMLPAWLKNKGEDERLPVMEAAKLPVVRAEIQQAIDTANTQVSRAEGVRAYRILADDFTEASGELTPKMSIKRHVILDKRSADIDALYAEAKKEQVGSAR
ncbi:AMP-dependent synthetase/ligase [uncultured Amnibacterium sp.]|uniref:AMP-dependent synthetase/ligase n=1 Tax=uncultured Amnibacterium sp. TaxID=1631851 RepID=UPI0035CB40D6